MNKPFSHQILEKFSTTYSNLINDENYVYYYKYLSIDKPNHNSLCAIKDNVLKFTHPCNFNDPYDSMILISLNNKPHLDQDNFIDRFRKKYAICCFSADPLNILMWSHYANYHGGFVMEFKIEKSVIDNTENILPTDYPFPIFYENTFPRINFPSSQKEIAKLIKTHEKMSEFMKKSLLMKAECWKYEEELRLIVDTHSKHNFKTLGDGSVLKPYKPNSLSRVILGANISTDNKDLIIDAVSAFNIKNNQDVNVVEAKLIGDEFRIVVPGIPQRGKTY